MSYTHIYWLLSLNKIIELMVEPASADLESSFATLLNSAPENNPGEDNLKVYNKFKRLDIATLQRVWDKVQEWDAANALEKTDFGLMIDPSDATPITEWRPSGATAKYYSQFKEDCSGRVDGLQGIYRQVFNGGEIVEGTAFNG